SSLGQNCTSALARGWPSSVTVPVTFLTPVPLEHPTRGSTASNCRQRNERDIMARLFILHPGSIIRNNFATVHAGQVLENGKRHGVRQEPDRAVAEQKMGSPGVPAAEAPGVLEFGVEIRRRVRTATTGRIAAARIVDVPKWIREVAMDRRVRA